MANTLNYAEPIPNLIKQRPYRFSKLDNDLIFENNKNVILGTNVRDNIEVWIYNSIGNVISNLLIRPEDEALSLSTIVDNTGAFEFLNINLEKLVERVFLPSGYYSIVLNFFRDEVGSMDGEKLYIRDISPSRTELRLSSAGTNSSLQSDLYEYTAPSVPRLYGKGLLDDLFKKDADPVRGDYPTPASILHELNGSLPDTTTRINNSSLHNEYNQLIAIILDRTYNVALDLYLSDISNANVQVVEFELLLRQALDQTIQDMKSKGEINPNFEIIL